MLSAQRSGDWPKAFQQDGDPKELDEKEMKATTQIQKREITSEPPKEMNTATVPSTQSTVTEMNNFITEKTPVSEMQTTEEKMQRSPTPALATMTTSGPTPQADTTVKAAAMPIMGRKLTELHPEMKQALEAKSKPVIVQEVKPSSKMTEMPPKADVLQRQENQSEPPKMVSSRPSTLMPKMDTTAVEMPNMELTTTKNSGADMTTKVKPNPTSPAPQPMGNSISLTRAEMKTENKPKMTPMKMSNMNAAQMKARRIPPLRASKVPKKNMVGMRPRGMKPVPKQQQRPQPNLKVRSISPYT